MSCHYYLMNLVWLIVMIFFFSVLGKQTLKSGEVHVFGGKPGSKISGVPGSRVGYVSI